MLKPSTRALIREARKTPGYTLMNFLHGYIYGRWIYYYIGIGVGKYPLLQTLGSYISRFTHLFKRSTPAAEVDPEINPLVSHTIADTYHGKVIPLDSAKQLVLINENIALPNLEHIIPYPTARDIILHNPDHIIALECPCRSARPNPCLPLDVCLVIGEPFASFVIEHHPDKSHRITPDEAVEILKPEDERGHVHHAFFKDAMLNRFYAICNCCACCCGAMHSQRTGSPMLASSGYIAHVDEMSCAGCGTCLPYCQFGAISLPGGTAIINTSACMGCGVCNTKCEMGAISLLRDPAKGEPLEIFKLMEASSALSAQQSA